VWRTDDQIAPTWLPPGEPNVIGVGCQSSSPGSSEDLRHHQWGRMLTGCSAGRPTPAHWRSSSQTFAELRQPVHEGTFDPAARRAAVL